MKQMLDLMQSLIVMALVLAGIGGLSYHAFRDDGFVEEFLGDIWEWQFQYPLIAIPLTVGAIVLYKVWSNGNMVKGRKGRAGDLLVYLLMGFGAYYIGVYAIHGTI